MTVALIKKLGLHPRRTIRVVFWVNEENGGAGGEAYRRMLGDTVSTHVAAIEMDGGAEKPVGFGFGSFEGRRRAMAPISPRPNSEEGHIPPTSAAAFSRVEEIGKLLESIEGGQISHGGGGSDIAPLMMAGVPGLGVRTVEAHYFDWHHTDADSFDKLVLKEFQANVASLAVMSYVLADMPERLNDMK
jgi:Zn-dependent M28 family amino/carboxypeptidase